MMDYLVARTNQLARKLKKQGSPTEGEDAVRLWEVCSGNHSIGVQTARKLYLKAGYVPFSGYPLKKGTS